MAIKAKKSGRGSKLAVKRAAKVPEKATPGRALSPFAELDMLFDRLSHELMSRMGFPALGDVGWPFQAHAPKIDMIDRGNELLVRAEIPGISKDDLQISLTDQTVTIRGESHKDTREEKGDYFRREISRGSFQRTLALPAAVAGDQAKATFADGVLELVLPKVDKPAGRKVTID
jgi:HSP20 family protein